MTSWTPADFEPLARGFYLEGLLVDGDDVWFTDVVVGGVRRHGSDQVLLPDRNLIGGLLLNDDGKVLVAGEGDIAWADPETGETGVVIGGIDGSNEMYPDGNGGLYVGTIDLPAIRRGEKPGPSSILHVSRNRVATCLRQGLSFANGLALAHDRSTLFFNESFSATRAFSVSADGALGEPRLLADRPDCDGMALDMDGNIWVTGFASDHIVCLRPDGVEVRRMELPGKAATSLRFGGSDMRDIYVNVVDPAAAQALGQGRASGEQTSVLYRTRSPVAGAPVARTAFDLAPTKAAR